MRLECYFEVIHTRTLSHNKLTVELENVQFILFPFVYIPLFTFIQQLWLYQTIE